MNILIFEYITGGGLVGEVVPASLVYEGELMLNAVANDFAELPHVQVSIMRDYRLQNGQVNNEYIVSADKGYDAIIQHLENKIDALLIIAPESDGILSSLCEIYSNRSFILLNSSVESTALMSDKFDTFKFLQKYNISQIPCFELTNFEVIQTDNIILKPRDGVGCENIKLLARTADIDDVVHQAGINNYIVQPYVQGLSASLSVLCFRGESILLCANIQEVEKVDDTLVLRKCIVNALDRKKFVEFSKNLIKSLPDLRGYIGIDIIITESETLLVEINPRLTTSYVGLKSALGVNPAALILEVFVNQKLPKLDYTSDKIIPVDMGAEHAA